jgi:SAM-dependent methyltransferase
MSGTTAAVHAEIGWDDPRTARAYEAFCARHPRYLEANAALVDRAALAPGQRVLDVAAGTGRTAEAALPWLHRRGTVLCVEPAAAMRAAGARRLRDPRATWAARLPEPPARFDRILCGAALWQMQPLTATVPRLAALLAPGGALCFSIPSLYLGEPDEPGGGRDPWLVALPALLASEATADVAPAEPLPDAAGLDALLAEAGLAPRRATVRFRLTQTAYRDWLKIPIVTNRLLSDLDPDARARRIDEVYARVDAGSWRWEAWTVWTAWAA